MLISPMPWSILHLTPQCHGHQSPLCCGPSTTTNLHSAMVTILYLHYLTTSSVPWSILYLHYHQPPLCHVLMVDSDAVVWCSQRTTPDDIQLISC